MGFVKFTEVGKNFSPRVIVHPNGVVHFNQGARKKFGLDRYSHCVMYMDHEQHRLGFELVEDENLDGANRLRRIQHEGVDLDARSFLEHFKLRFKRSVGFPVRCDLNNGWLMLSLDEGEALPVSARGASEEGNGVSPHPVQRGGGEGPDGWRPATNTGTPERGAIRVVAGGHAAHASGGSSANGKGELPGRSGEVAANAAAVPIARPRGVKAMLSELLQD